jgi:hypothetical protein
LTQSYEASGVAAGGVAVGGADSVGASAGTQEGWLIRVQSMEGMLVGSVGGRTSCATQRECRADR